MSIRSERRHGHRPSRRFPFRLRTLAALVQAGIAVGALSAATPAPAATKHIADFFPGILWSNPFAWGPTGEPRGGDVIYVDKGPGIAFAPILGIDETFEALTINASTDTDRLLYVPSPSGPIPVPTVGDFPANVLLPAMHLRSNNVTVGDTGAGALIQTGGFLTVNLDLRLGHADSGWGFYSITSPDFTSGAHVRRDAFIGAGGLGTVVMSNNVFSVDRDLTFGDLASGIGSMQFAGALTVGRDEILGNAGTGRMIQGVSLHTVGNDFILARGAGSQGSFTGLPGSRLHVGQDLVIGAAGNGSMTFSGGEMRVGNDLVVAAAGGSKGTLHLDGPSFVTIARDFVVGDGGEGSGRKVLDLLSSVQVGRDLILGRAAGGAGTFEMLAGNMTVTRDVVVGHGGRGLFVVGALSGLTVDGNVTVGRSNATVGLPPLSLPGLPDVSLGELIANAASNTPSPTLGTTFGKLPDIGLSPDLQYTAFRTFSDGIRIDFPFVPANTMIVLAGGVVQLHGNLVVGAEGKGVFGHFAAGTVVVDGSLIVGQQGEGVYSAAALANLVVKGDWIVGDAGKGVWAGGGTMVVQGDTLFGRQAGSRALVNYAAGGGTKLEQDLILGDHGNATLAQAGSGGFLVTGSFIAGREADGVGQWDIAADQMSITGDLVLGARGRGTATMRQGTALSVKGNAVLGQSAGSHGTLDMQGTSFGVDGPMIVGAAGEASLRIRNASSLILGGNLTFGELAGATGTGTFDNGAYLQVGGTLNVGAAGHGTVDFQSGQSASSGAVFIIKSDVMFGRDEGATGTGTLLGLTGNAPSIAIAGSMTLGSSGVGNFTHTGGQVGIGGDLTLGASGFGSGRYEIDGGANLRVDRDLLLGITGQAEFVQRGGDVTVAGTLAMARHGQPSSYQLLGGKLLAHEAWINTNASFTAGLGRVSFDRASVFDGTVDLGRDADLVLQANAVSPVHRMGHLDLTGGTVRVGKLTILSDGSIHQNGGELDTLQIVFDHGTVTGELQSKRLFTVLGPTPAVFGGRLRNEGVIELLADFEAADGVDNRATFDIAAGRTVKLTGFGLANRGDMTLRGHLVTSETVDARQFRQYGGSHVTDNLRVQDGDGAQARYSLIDGLLQVDQFSTIGATDTPGLFVQEGGTHRVGRFLRIAGGGRYTMVGGSIVAGTVLNEGLFEVINGRIDAPFENAGRLKWESQGDIDGTGSLTNLPSGSFEASATGSFGLAVVNRGQWTKEGAGLQTYSGVVTQDGSLLINAGTLRLTGGATGEGSTNLATGSSIELAGGATYAFSRQFNNNGRVLLDPAAATFSGSGLHTGRFDVGAGGELTFAGVSWTFNGVGSGIAGTGAMTFASGLTTFGNGSAFTLTGPLHLTGGSVRFLAGSSMTLPESFVIEGTALELSTGTGQSYGRTLTLNAGGLGGADPFELTAGNLDWNGGTLFGPAALTLRNGTQLRIAGTDYKALEREVVVQDKAQWNSGDVFGSGLLHVAETGVFSVLTGGAFQANVLAQGRLDLIAPDQVAHFSGGFIAEADVWLRDGTLRLSGNGESTAAFIVFSRGTAEFADGTFVFHGRDARLDGLGRALFSGGTVVFRDGASYAMSSERITGGTLDFQPGSAYTLNAGLVLEGGNLLVNAGHPFVLPLSTRLESGLLGGSDAKHVNTEYVFTWSGGTIAGGGVSVLPRGRMEIVPDGIKVLETGVTNAGVIAWSGSDVAGPGSFTNLAEGVFEITGSGTLFPSLVNAGQLVMNGANENAVLRGAFTNTGTVEVNAGTLHVLGSFSNLSGSTLSGGRYELRGTLHHEGQGIRTIAADVTLAGTGAFVRSGTNQSLLDTLDTVAAGGRFTVSGGRDFTMANRPLTVEGEFRVGNGSTFTAQASNLGGSGVMRVADGGLFVWTGATLNSNGTLHVDDGGVLRISGGNNHDMDRRTLLNAGKVEWQGGTIRGGNGGRIDNRGLWVDATTGTADINRAYGGGAGEVYNGGVWRKTGDATTRIFDQGFNNAGTVELQAGVLELHGGGTTTAGGRFEIAEGATLGLRNSYRFSGDTVVSGAGWTEATGGVLTLENAVAFSQLALAGSAMLAGTHQFSGHLLWTTGNMNSAGTTTITAGSLLTIAGAGHHDLDRRTLINDGTVAWEAGNVRGGNGTSIVNKGLWLDRIAGNAEFNRAYGGGDGEWVNNGVYRKTTNTITTFAHTLRNLGVFELDAGTLRLSGGTTHVTGSRITVAGGAVLEMHATQTFQDGVTLEGPAKLLGTAIVNGNLTASDVEIAGGSLAGNHTLHGNYRWTSGNLNNPGTTTIASDAMLTIAGAGNHDLDRRTLINEGTVAWEGGNVRGGNGTTIVNNGLWLDRIAADAEFNRAYGGGDGEWVNSGTYRKSTGAITTFAHTLRNRGVFEVNAGTLRLAGGTTHETGSRIAVATGAMLEIRSSHTFQDGVTLDGPTKLIGAAAVTGNLTASDFEIAGGTLTGDHTLHGNYRWNTGNLNGSGLTIIGSNAVFTIATGNDHDLDRRLLINRGEVHWLSGAIRSGNGGAIENAALWLDQTSGVTDINRAYGGGGGRFLNAGTYLKTGSGLTRILEQPFDNTGLVSIEAGTLALHGGGTMSSTSHVGIADGAALGVHSVVTFADGSAVTGPGKVLVTNGVANMQGAVSFSHLVIGNGGQLAGTHTLSGDVLWTEGTFNGPGTTTVGAGARLTISGTNDHDLDRRTLVNDGTASWEGGNVRGGNGSRITNNGLWLDRVASDAQFNRAYGGGDGEWLNAGTYRKSTNTITTFAHTLRNRGVFDVNAGTLRLAGGTTHETGSSITVATGAALEIFATHTFQDGVTLTGTTRLFGAAVITGHLTASDVEIGSNATLHGTHTLHGGYRWTTGLLNSVGTTRLANDAVFEIVGSNNHDMDRRTFVNDGTVRWGAGAIRGGNGSRIENTGLWLDETTGVTSIDRAYGGGAGNFANSGTYRKTGAGTTLITQQAFDNTGTVDVQAGRLELQGGVAQIQGNALTGGSWHVGANSAIVVAGAPIVTVNSGTVWLQGTGSSFSPIDGLADNRGTFKLTDGRVFTTVGSLANSGSIFVGTGSTLRVLGRLDLGGTVGGGGLIGATNTRARGRLTPGASPGELTIEGDLELEPSASLEIEIAGLAAGSEYDVLRVTGAVTLGGVLDVKLLRTFAGLTGGTFAFVSAQSVSGTFDGIADGDRIFTADGGGSFLVDYTPDAVYLTDFSPTAAVPEPQTWMLMLMGGVFVVGAMRRRGVRAR